MHFRLYNIYNLQQVYWATSPTRWRKFCIYSIQVWLLPQTRGDTLQASSRYRNKEHPPAWLCDLEQQRFSWQELFLPQVTHEVAQTNEYRASHLSGPERSLRQYGELAEMIPLDYPYPLQCLRSCENQKPQGLWGQTGSFYQNAETWVNYGCFEIATHLLEPGVWGCSSSKGNPAWALDPSPAPFPGTTAPPLLPLHRPILWVLKCPACVHAKSLQSCPALCDPRDCSPPSASVHGILQAKILEWVAMPSSRGSFQPRDQTCVSRGSYIAGGFLTTELPGKPSSLKQKNNFHNPTQNKTTPQFYTHTHPNSHPWSSQVPPTPGTPPPQDSPAAF